MGKKKQSEFLDKVNIKNKQAFFNYQIEEKFVGGLQLQGTEIKSIRQGKASFVDGYCIMDKGEAFVKGLHISPYKLASFKNHDPDRNKKLLLRKKEIQKLEKKINEKGFTVVPLRLFISERGFAKLEIGLGKGKKLHDKRETIKERDLKREIKEYK